MRASGCLVELGQGSRLDKAAVMHEPEAIAEPLGLIEMMRRQYDRLPLAANVGHELGDDLASQHVEAEGQLIEQQPAKSWWIKAWPGSLRQLTAGHVLRCAATPLQKLGQAQVSWPSPISSLSAYSGLEAAGDPAKKRSISRTER